MKEVLDEFDQLSEVESRARYKHSDLEDKLAEILALPELKLTHGRLINLVWVGKRLGVNPNSIVKTPNLKALIDAKTQEIERRCRQGVTSKSFQIGGVDHLNVGSTPYSDVHNRVFDFSGLAEPFGQAFTERVATAFLLIIASQKSPKAYYQRILHFLLWVAEHSSRFQDVMDRLRENKRPDEPVFERTALLYQQEVLAELSAAAKAAEGQRVGPSFSVIEKFGEAGIFPKMRFRSVNHRRADHNRSARPTLVEAPLIEKDIEDILKITIDSAAYRDICFSANKDTKAFAEALAQERRDRDDLPHELPEAIRVLCDERLLELRRAASRIFVEWQEKHKIGRELIAKAQYSGAEIARRLEKGASFESQRDRNRTIEALFPKKDTRVALCNLLAFLDSAYDGLCPSTTKEFPERSWYSTYGRLGGKEHVQQYLWPSRIVVSAVVCLYLCESGANPSVGLTLSSKALRPSRLSKHVNVVGNKGRSAGKPIYNELPITSNLADTISAAKALYYLQKEVWSPRLEESTQSHPLASYAGNGAVKSLQEWQLREDMQSIASTSSRLSGVKVLPSMIRPTVLLSAQLRNPQNLGVAQLLAHHEHEDTTMGYVAKLPYRVILENRIREFTDTLQVTMAAGIDGAGKTLGIDEEIWEKYEKSARRTGLGVFCADPSAGVQTDFPEGSECLALDRCVNCRNLLVVAEPESIADMIIWQKALESAQEDWLNERYERWEKVWIPWKAFFDVVLNEKMSRGELAKIKATAEQIASSRLASEKAVLPRPW